MAPASNNHHLYSVFTTALSSLLLLLGFMGYTTGCCCLLTVHEQKKEYILQLCIEFVLPIPQLLYSMCAPQLLLLFVQLHRGGPPHLHALAVATSDWRGEAEGRERERNPRKAKMIYRNWSLLSSTVVIWGGVATAGLAGIFLFGGKEKFNDYLCREGERLRQQDRAAMGRS